ncbi:MAG: DUF6364 family protein [Pseudonocardiaceae bacterium]
MKRNLTVQLDEELIHRAKVIAAERGTSVSGLAAQQITKLVVELSGERLDTSGDTEVAQCSACAACCRGFSVTH